MKLAVPNPLLDRLPAYETPKQVMDAITYHPLDGINPKELSFIQKDALLVGEKSILAPTKKSLLAALTWYGMLRTGYANRNPVLIENKRKYYEQLNGQGLPDFSSPSPTRGMAVNVIKGPAGTGKTITIQRFCASLPQVIEHGKNEAAGWLYHKQLVYMHIDLAHDGSRGGFMYAILVAIDKALGTQYATSLPKQNRTIEKLAIATFGRLLAHHVGIIFIDESQLRNLVKNGQAELMQLFLLQLMNIGIPLVISGNERAFDWLTYSQDLSRLTLTSISHFHPIGALYEDGHTEWNALADGIMKFYVLNSPISNTDACSRKLFECSGGIARLALTLWCQAQRECLYEQREYVTAEDIHQAYLSYTFSSIKPLADGFRFKNSRLLAQFPDVDSNFYEQYWKNPEDPINVDAAEQVITDTQQDLNSSNQSRPKTKSELSKFKARKTASANKERKAAELRQQLPDDDIRINGLIKHNLDQLARLKGEIEGSE